MQPWTILYWCLIGFHPSVWLSLYSMHVADWSIGTRWGSPFPCDDSPPVGRALMCSHARAWQCIHHGGMAERYVLPWLDSWNWKLPRGGELQIQLWGLIVSSLRRRGYQIWICGEVDAVSVSLLMCQKIDRVMGWLSSLPTDAEDELRSGMWCERYTVFLISRTTSISTRVRLLDVLAESRVQRGVLLPICDLECLRRRWIGWWFWLSQRRHFARVWQAKKQMVSLYQVSHLHLSDFETTSLPTKHVVCTLETRGVGDVDEIPTLVIHTLSQS